MTRLHPQDPRAWIAGRLLERLIGFEPMQNKLARAIAIKETDELLAELERTAKAEAAKDETPESRNLLFVRCRSCGEKCYSHQALLDHKCAAPEPEPLKSSIDECIEQAKAEERERIIALLAEMGYLSYEVRSAIEIQGEKK